MQLAVRLDRRRSACAARAASGRHRVRGTICMMVMPVSAKPLEDRRLNRRRAAQLRQQRGVDVERAVRRQVDDGRREDAPVRHDHRDVGLELAHRRHELLAARLLGLQHRDSLGQRHTLHRRRIELRARPSARLVGLRHDAHDIVSSPSSARSGGTAKSGVPQNRMRTVRLGGGRQPAEAASRSGGRSPTGNTRSNFGYFDFSSSHSRIAARRLSRLRRSVNSLPCR